MSSPPVLEVRVPAGPPDALSGAAKLVWLGGKLRARREWPSAGREKEGTLTKPAENSTPPAENSAPRAKRYLHHLRRSRFWIGSGIRCVAEKCARVSRTTALCAPAACRADGAEGKHLNSRVCSIKARFPRR